MNAFEKDEILNITCGQQKDTLKKYMYEHLFLRLIGHICFSFDVIGRRLVIESNWFAL